MAGGGGGTCDGRAGRAGHILGSLTPDRRSGDVWTRFFEGFLMNIEEESIQTNRLNAGAMPLLAVLALLAGCTQNESKGVSPTDITKFRASSHSRRLLVPSALSKLRTVH